LLGDASLRETIAAGGHEVFAKFMAIAAQAARLQSVYREIMVTGSSVHSSVLE
jgi:hypothetical protein